MIVPCPECGFYLCDNKECVCHIIHDANPWATSPHLEEYYKQEWQRSTSTTYVPPQFRYTDRVRRCPSCEEPIAVTDHKCKAEDKATDWLDVMADIEQRDKE